MSEADTHNLTDLESCGFKILTQHVVVAGELAVRVAIQYHPALVSERIAEIALNTTTTQIANSLASELTAMEGKHD